MKFPLMPKVQPRRPFHDHLPNGLLESLKDWIHNNMNAVEWFLENEQAIRKVLDKPKAN